MNAAANDRIYLEKPQLTLMYLHKCRAVHSATVPGREVFRGQAVWQKDVEVFDFTCCPNAKRAKAWRHSDGKNDERERLVSVLDIPPIKSAVTAVRVQIVMDALRGWKKKFRIKTMQPK